MPEKMENADIRIMKVVPDMCDDLFEAIESSREFLRQYLFWVDGVKNPADEAASIRMFLENWDKGDSFIYAVYEKNSGRLAGTIDAHAINRNDHVAYIGYWLRKDQTGHGFISKALAPLEKILFDQGIHRIVIMCEVSNLPSAAVAERNHYVFEGIAKERICSYGEFHDAKIYAKLASAL